MTYHRKHRVGCTRYETQQLDPLCRGCQRDAVDDACYAALGLVNPAARYRSLRRHGDPGLRAPYWCERCGRWHTRRRCRTPATPRARRPQEPRGPHDAGPRP